MKKTLTIFLILTVIYIIGNTIWYQINKPIFILQYANATYFLDALDIKNFFVITPPLFPLIMNLFFYIFNQNNYVVIYMFLNIVFFAISLLFLYKIGERINGIHCGRISMILFAAVPAIYGLSRFYGRQDFHIIPILLMGIYFLIQSDMFKNQKWTIFYAISLGLGLLLRETFLGFAIPFFLFYIIWTVFQGINKYQLYNVIIMFIISSILYSFQFTQTLKFSFLYTPFMEQKIFETLFMKFHIIIGGLSENILALPLFLLLIFSIIFIFFKKKYKDNLILMLLCGLFIPIIIALVIPHHKQQVYMVPLIPAIILLIAASVSYLNVNIRKILLTIFIAVSLLQYIELSYGYKTWICDWQIKINDTLSFKYFDKYNEDTIFYNIKKRDRYIQLLKSVKLMKNKKILILADGYPNAKYNIYALRPFFIINGFKIMTIVTTVMNLYLYGDPVKYDFIIDLRSYTDFNYEYDNMTNDIKEHKYINNFYIPSKNEFLNKYNSFWSMYHKTNDININIHSVVYKFKDNN